MQRALRAAGASTVATSAHAKTALPATPSPGSASVRTGGTAPTAGKVSATVVWPFHLSVSLPSCLFC